MAKGTLYIVPVHIAEDSIDRVIPAYNHQIVGRLRVFAVERLKTARQFLRKVSFLAAIFSRSTAFQGLTLHFPSRKTVALHTTIDADT